MKLSSFASIIVLSAFLISNSVDANESNLALRTSVEDRAAIQALLATYTRAVSTKDEALFDTILLNRSISFAYVSAKNSEPLRSGIANYEGFRKSVFSGEQFTQTFENVSIVQDGNLADVRLVFVNTEAHRSSWGWKTMQLLKVGSKWKIASEFFTSH